MSSTARSEPLRLRTGLLAALLLVPLVGAPMSSSEARTVVAREVVAEGLAWPVGIAFTPGGRLLYNERLTGRLREVVDGSPAPGDLGNVSVVTGGEQGLLGLVLDPDFPATGWAYVYHTYFNGSAGRPMNRVSRLVVGPASSTPTIILDGIPAATFHNGGILGFAPDRTLFVTTGDATDPAASQDPASLSGKALRLLRDGGRPPDNPIPGSYAFTIGHRNVFGLAFHPSTGRAYISENGPIEGDEINLLEPGANYGWPHVTGMAGDPRYVDPLVAFGAAIAPTGIAFLGDDLFLGDWNRGELQRIRLAPPDFRDVVGIETVARFEPNGILDVEAGPDGALYLSTPDAIHRLRFSSASEPSLALPFVFAFLAAGAGFIVWAILRTRRP